MFAYKLAVLSNVFVVEIGDTQVKQYVEDIGKIKNSKVQAKLFGPNSVLHTHINAQNPKRFYKNIE